MKIKHIRDLLGPNIYTSNPALVVQLDLGELSGRKTREFTNFNKNLLKLLASFRELSAGSRRAESCAQHLAEGASFSCMFECLVTELSRLADCSIGISKIEFCETEEEPKNFRVVFEYQSEIATRLLLKTSIEIIKKLIDGEQLKQIRNFMDERLAETRCLVLAQEHKSKFESIINNARGRNIPVQLVNENSLQLGYGKNSRLVQAESDEQNSSDVRENAVDNSKYGAALIETLYPSNAQSRIPLISITGTNGKTTVTRIIAHIFAEAGNSVGMTTTDGIWIGGECVEKGDTTGPKSARRILSDQTVDVAVLETARGGIIRRGLGYDWSDVSVITNIQPDHFGQDGIENINDILRIKSLVAERVRVGGTLVLNADDELLAHLANDPRVNKIPKEIVYFSLKPNHVTLKRHTLAGGAAYTVRNGWLVEATRNGEMPIIEIAEIPITFAGFAEFNVANVLAATAACRAQILTFEQIAKGLGSFQAERHNHGRANLYEVDGAYVFLDYGHNPEAFKSVCKMAAKWDDGERRVTGIIAVPGDRANSLIMQAGRIAARGFHRIVIREDEDLRGRIAGETAQILFYAVKDEMPDTDCQIILNESEAVRREITRLQPGDILICFYENYNLVRGILDQCDAHPTDHIKLIPDRSFYNFRHA